MNSTVYFTTLSEMLFSKLELYKDIFFSISWIAFSLDFLLVSLKHLLHLLYDILQKFEWQHCTVTILTPWHFINFTKAHPNGSITSHYVNYIINIFTRFSLKKFYVDADFMCPVLYVSEGISANYFECEGYIFLYILWNGGIEF